ncbi:MAG: glycosyltransferase [Candidatus Saccharimonas sp.]
MNQPLVSVVIPTRNSSQTLADCLKSIKLQTYTSIEIIVVDNFSTDSTPEIARDFTDIFFSEGPERSAQRNFAVKKAKGEYVCIIDSDMNLDPKVIEECVRKIQEISTLRGIVIPEESFGEGFWARCKQLERSFYVGVPYMEAARFFYKRDFLKLGGYNSDMVSGEDWDLSQRIESLGGIDRTDAIIHHNEGRISLIKTIKKKFYYAKLFKSYVTTPYNSKNVTQQTNILGRYSLFFSNPKRLLRNPILGVGMLFMKTCEFGFGGIGYIISSISRPKV